ncbi:MAG: MGH1-like glycoside hydrolase domain-containing protein [Prevotella sp.]
MKRTFIIALSTVLAMLSATDGMAQSDHKAYDNIIDIHLTPGAPRRHNGCFSDMGSWMGFTLPERNKPTAGFCGPFSIYYRNWYARSLVSIEGATTVEDNYQPGQITMKLRKGSANISQSLQFVDARTALLTIRGTDASTVLSADSVSTKMSLRVDGQQVIIGNKGGEAVVLTFPPYVSLRQHGHNYKATIEQGHNEVNVVISLVEQDTELTISQSAVAGLLACPIPALQASSDRWQGYFDRVIRKDLPTEYNRVAAKSIVTLISNWRARRGAVYHDGIVPSHAVNYFVGCWAWDCWRFSAAMASFFPELAKDNIRVMFDYQQADGMVIDCIYPDASENNNRDSKPPLAAWAVNEIYEHNADTAFLAEMYPKLLKYHKWWYEKRDHDRNGICEFGSVDGTLEAAAWESGMDNAIRFDGTEMLRNADDAYSTNQESVDLNAYLAMEYTLLKKFADILGQEFNLPDRRQGIADYFFDDKEGYFFDRRLDADRSFVREAGCEGYIPFWASIATKKQFDKARRLLDDEKKFSTYIPFPTIAADNPKYDANGYWRGPIWLDQTYYAIKAYRNYGYGQKADAYTRQVFDRLQGLTADAPIHENYDTHTGAPLQASHFSWSASCLLMLYNDLGK